MTGPPFVLGAFDQALAAVGAGEQARVHAAVPVKLAVADRSQALMPLADAGAVESAVLVRAPSVVGALVHLFDMLWAQACPLADWSATGTDDGSGGSVVADESTQRLIALMATGITDESIARELGLSVRTLGRRIALLLNDFGAHTRFQAGMQAARVNPQLPAAAR